MIVRYAERSRTHLRGIAEHIRRDNPAAAARVLDRVDEAVKRLADFPFISRRGVRRGSVRTYSLEPTLHRRLWGRSRAH
ncbi:type II toxin-antitoxin system RelE/ParE family toxin [Chenggangzhangella methanolivorans]|uniref:Type II toxin-antitoxin system RelE/ParE family toxin n=1 Tax=Chenggangzhangella methanolivorans TaxID=1437009 RepID=A0A9E6UNM8_9HYPH|nr:type II toxin-antitoxin system RelE/ParE family toxin [Chenggangzhangella methanolivorans]